MGLWKRLFGKREMSQNDRPLEVDPSQAGDMVRCMDSYGREVFVTKQEWQKVLLTNLKNARNDPTKLYGLILNAIQNGFVAVTVPFAEHLHRIDPEPARGATVLGIVYLKLNRLNEAQNVLQDHMRKHGEDGVVLTNLAKVVDARGESAMADATLWHALELDPNQDNGLLWFAAREREKNEEVGWTSAMQRVAQFPGSWRPQLWLAHSALQQGDKSGALSLYETVLARCPRPVPGDVLTQITGDLGERGHLVEAIKLAGPNFDATTHGIELGNNLIKANLELGRLDHARAIVDQLYALKEPAYEQLLSFWNSEIAKARTAARDSTEPRLESFTLLKIHGPLWMNDDASPNKLVGDKPDDAVVISFIGATATMPGQTAAKLQMSDGPGRLSRALPLYLCEQLHLSTDAIGEVLQPFLTGTGFLLSGMAWEDDFVAHQARQSEVSADYAVVSHLDKTAGQDAVLLRLLRTIDAAQLDSISIPLNYSQPATAAKESAAWLLDAIRRLCPIQHAKTSWYVPPEDERLNDYLLRLEQSLAVRLSELDEALEGFLSGERDILSGCIQLCLQCPKNIATRLLLVHALEAMSKVCPQAVAEFAERVGQLQKDCPLPSPYQEYSNMRLVTLYRPLVPGAVKD